MLVGHQINENAWLTVFDPAAEEAGPSSDPPGPQQLKLGSIESHWQTETDYYAATVVLDFLSFAFVALFYQVQHS